MTDPRLPEFWNAEFERMYQEYGPLLLRILYEGFAGGAKLLPHGIDLLINWDNVNADAIIWLRQYGLKWLYGINQTTQRGAVNAIDAWITAGEPLPVLVKRLEPLFGKPRAERIAVTEVTRIFAEGNEMAWKATGGMVGGKRWMTAMDDKVCPICQPLHDKVVKVGWAFPSIIGGGFMGPPAHVGCRCWTQPVVDIEAIVESALKELR